MSGDSSEEEGALQIDCGEPEGGKKGKGGRDRVTWKPGDVVWAKVSGFNFWPAKVFDRADPIIPDWLREPPKPTYVLVRFFGAYDIQWVSANTTKSYENGIKKRFHSKSKSKTFQKAVKEALEFLDSGVLPEGLTAPPPDRDETRFEPERTVRVVQSETSEEVKASSGGGKQLVSGAKRKSPSATTRKGRTRAVSGLNKKAKLDSDDKWDGDDAGTSLLPQEERVAGRKRCNEVIKDLRLVSSTMDTKVEGGSS